MTDEEWRTLYENFETHWLLDAVDDVDRLRDHLSDQDGFRPPEIRDKLLKLHGLAMEVVNNGWHSRLEEFFDLAIELDDQVADMMDSLEKIQTTLGKLVQLYPESLAEGDGEDARDEDESE